MERKETTVQCATLILKHTHFHLYASLTEFADATSLHLGKLIDAANDNTSDALPYNQVSTEANAFTSAWPSPHRT